MIEQGTGNLLTADVDALVNTVNTEGVMGKGIALQFKKAFPEAFTSYERACRNSEVQTGEMHVVKRLVSPYYIINFPTKRHWRQPSRLEYVRSGLEDLTRQIRELKIQSIAIPPLGCGNGGLNWSDVRVLIEQAFADMADVRVVVFEPKASPAPSLVIDRRKKPKMTPARAALLTLMERYLRTGYGYRLSLLEVQKLAYFLQSAGEPLRLNYEQGQYGPYADNLRQVLKHMEGHYTQGVGDGKNSPTTPLEILPNALSEAEALVGRDDGLQYRLERVAQLIEGFETPFGMELLATAHWVMKLAPDVSNVREIIANVHRWNDRKRLTMKDGHIQAAWLRLRSQSWV